MSACENPARTAFNIGGLGQGQSFIGTGEDTGAGFAVFSNEAKSGYHMRKGDEVTAWAKLVNYNKEEAKVYLTYDLEWLEGLVGDDVRWSRFVRSCVT